MSSSGHKASGSQQQQQQQQQQPLSVARLSLLRKSVGVVGEHLGSAVGGTPPNQRRRSGGISGWRTAILRNPADQLEQPWPPCSTWPR